MISPSELGIDNFDSWRGTQWQVITDVLGSDKRIILIEAPPGIGKSGIGVAISRILLNHGERTMYLTSTKQLQDQYMMFPGIMKVMGRQNYPCKIDLNVNADEGICTFGRACNHRGLNSEVGCAYYDMRREAREVSDLVINYPYALRQIGAMKDNEGHETGTLGWPSIIICDEAHHLRQQLESYYGTMLRISHLNLLKQAAPCKINEIPSDKQLDSWRGKVGKWIEKELENSNGVWFKADLNKEERKYLIALRDVRQVLEEIEELTSHDDGFVIEPSLLGWEFKPIWVQGGMDKFMSHSKKVIMMSASILDKGLFCQSLGLDTDEVEFLRYDSPFDVSRRPFHYLPIAKVKGGDIDSYHQVIEAMDIVIENYHEGEKGVIHTSNYGLAKAVMERSRYRDIMITHDSLNRIDRLEEFKESENKILVSPSMTTGVDLPYDQLRYQIILKMPFPDLSSRQRAAQMETPLGKRLYQYDTATTLVQTYGRAMRAEDDYGVTYLLDASFGFFRKANRSLLPQWFTEAIIEG